MAFNNFVDHSKRDDIAGSDLRPRHSLVRIREKMSLVCREKGFLGVHRDDSLLPVATNVNRDSASRRGGSDALCEQVMNHAADMDGIQGDRGQVDIRQQIDPNLLPRR